MLVRFIGDVHGRYEVYLSYLVSCTYSVQVGDFGFGFKCSPKLPRFGFHKILRGNHDDPELAALHPNVVPDGLYADNIFYIGGSCSIDKDQRIQGVDWWPEEELSIPRLYEILDYYQKVRPRVVVSHDCPEKVLPLLGITRSANESRTRQALQAMLDVHRPKLWVFGHWHQSLEVEIEGTRFVCLNKLEYKDINI